MDCFIDIRFLAYGEVGRDEKYDILLAFDKWNLWNSSEGLDEYYIYEVYT